MEESLNGKRFPDAGQGKTLLAKQTQKQKDNQIDKL